MSSPPLDPYGTLSVSKDASTQDIRTAYRKLVLKCHPDKVQDPALKAEMQNKFQEVQQAYEILSDEKERRKHDELVESLARLAALKQQKAANAAKANTSSPRPTKTSSSEYYPEPRSASYRPAPESRPSYSYTTRYYTTRSSDNEYDDTEPPSSSRRKEGSSYADRDREGRSSKRESERDRAYQKEKDRERERERERESDKERKRREKIEKEERKREKERRREQEEKEAKEARREAKKQRERQESKARKSETREKAAREAYITPPPMAEDYVSRPKEKKSSSRKHREEIPDYIQDQVNVAMNYQRTALSAHGVQGAKAHDARAPPAAPTPPPSSSPYTSPAEDEPRRRSSVRRGSDAQSVRHKPSYNSKSSREHLDNLEEEPPLARSPAAYNTSSSYGMAPEPPRPSRTQTMPMDSTHTATRPPPVHPGNLQRAYTDIPANRGRGRSRLESQVEEEEEESRRGRDRDGRERKSSRQSKKSSSYRDEKYREDRHVYAVDKGADGVSRTKPLHRSNTYSSRGGYDDYYYSEASPQVRYVSRPPMEARTSSYQSSAYGGYSPPEYSAKYEAPRFGKQYGAADLDYSSPVHV